MDNPWVSNALPATKPVGTKRSVKPADQLDVGGPIPVTIRARDDSAYAAGFYDQETDTLSVNILPFEPYDSFVESKDIRIDTDQAGRPVFMEISRPRGNWLIEFGLTMPEPEHDGCLYLRDTLRRFPEGEVLTNEGRDVVCVKFLARDGDAVIRLADNMLAEIADGFLVAVWLEGVQMDFAGRKQSQWRAATAARLRKNGSSWNPCTKGKLSENSLQRQKS